MAKLSTIIRYAEDSVILATNPSDLQYLMDQILQHSEKYEPYTEYIQNQTVDNHHITYHPKSVNKGNRIDLISTLWQHR